MSPPSQRVSAAGTAGDATTVLWSVDPSHDAWRHGGLGGSARQVAELLADGQRRSVAVVAGQLGVSRSWARELLRRLRSAGLAVSGPAGWVLTDPAGWSELLDVAAVVVGTAGRGAVQRSEHAEDRTTYAEVRWRQRTRAARQVPVVLGEVEGPDGVRWLVEVGTGVLVGAVGVDQDVDAEVVW